MQLTKPKLSLSTSLGTKGSTVFKVAKLKVAAPMHQVPR